MTQQEKDLRTSAKIVTQKSARCFLKRATYKRLNSRRGELIESKIVESATDAELAEFRVLQDEVGRLIDLAFPRDTSILEELETLLAKLESKNKLTGENLCHRQPTPKA